MHLPSSQEREILIFDEPTSGLDFKHMKRTAELFASLKGKQTVLIVTHDPELIQRCCDYRIHLKNGQVILHEQNVIMNNYLDEKAKRTIHITTKPPFTTILHK